MDELVVDVRPRYVDDDTPVWCRQGELERGSIAGMDDRAPLELAGRVAMEGVTLFDDDSPARVEWLARTRKIYSDERYRFERAHREFAESVGRSG